MYRKKGKHISPDERTSIECLYKMHYTQKAIADIIGVSQQAISKELRKGRTQQLNGATWEFYHTYTADTAQRVTEYRKSAHGPDLKIGNNYAYLQALENRVLEGYSPYDAIHAIKDKSNFDIHISKTTFYRYIAMGLFPSLMYKHLPNGHPKKGKNTVVRLRTNHPLHTSIERRDPEILTRQQYGHWELDSIIGKAKGNKESCLVLTERKTRAEIMLKVESKTADATVKALTRLKRQMGRDYTTIIQTISCDNGTEFADENGIKNLGAPVFYCHPACPSERGSNENQNKILRRKFPKGQSMAKKTQEHATQAAYFANDCHREMFKGETSLQRLTRELDALQLHNPDRIKRFFQII